MVEFNECVAGINNKCHPEALTLGQTTPAFPTIPHMTLCPEHSSFFPPGHHIRVAVFLLSNGPLKQTQISRCAWTSTTVEWGTLSLCALRCHPCSLALPGFIFSILLWLHL